jgi:hypothetical protein
VIAGVGVPVFEMQTPLASPVGTISASRVNAGLMLLSGIY